MASLLLCKEALTSTHGRSLIATKDIAPGDVVLLEAPSVLSPVMDVNLPDAAKDTVAALEASATGSELFKGASTVAEKHVCAQLQMDEHKELRDTLCAVSTGRLPAAAACVEMRQLYSNAFWHSATIPSAAASKKSAAPPKAQASAVASGADDEEVSLVALYRYVSAANHSCYPNAILVTEAASVSSVRSAIVAVASIPAGHEVTISYREIYGPTSVRQQYLHDQYGFQCDCFRCTGVRPALPVIVSDDAAASASKADDDDEPATADRVQQTWEKLVEGLNPASVVPMGSEPADSPVQQHLMKLLASGFDQYGVEANDVALQTDPARFTIPVWGATQQAWPVGHWRRVAVARLARDAAGDQQAGSEVQRAMLALEEALRHGSTDRVIHARAFTHTLGDATKLAIAAFSKH